MNAESRLTLRYPAAAAAVVVLLVVGAAISYVVLRSQRGDDAVEPADPGPPKLHAKVEAGPHVGAEGSAAVRPEAGGHVGDRDGAPLPDVTVTLTEDAVDRAGIEVTPVRSGGAGAQVRVAGVVEPNAYRQVIVTPLVAGRITRVLVALGDRVGRGQTLAQVYSPELADAQTTYLSMRAELQAHEQQLRRTERLVEIGAASRQELEQVHAAHTSLTAGVEGARSRLVLLGISDPALEKLAAPTEISATTNVPAPIAGVVTTRRANPGLNVDPATTLFTVVDLSSVWIVGALYEKDFPRVRVGSPAVVTMTAYPDRVLQGRVSYIDSQVNPDTRTAQVRVEVGNPRADLRFGMYAELQVGLVGRNFSSGDPGGQSTAVVPRSALQIVADRHVVYLVNPEERGRFVEREVRLGDAAGDEVEILAGVKAGDVVVAEGSFFIRAERERLGLRQQAGAAPGAGAPSPTQPRGDRGSPAVQTARVTVTDQGYEPSRLTLRAGVPAKITFVRTSDKTCGTAVAFPSLDIRRDLPLNQPVDIDFTPQKTGEISFVCGMNMLRGTVIVQ